MADTDIKIIIVIDFNDNSCFCSKDDKYTFCIYQQRQGTNFGFNFSYGNIASIKVTNIYGAHILTNKELNVLKEQLKKQKFAGGLLIKPGHILLDIKLKDSTITKSGFVYASTGEIHFANGVDRFKEKFSGTFILPQKINFDNYK